MRIYVYAFLRKFGKMSQMRVSRGSTQIITILHRRGHWNFLLQYYRGGGGLPDLLQYYKGEGGVSRDPKFVLRNIWTAPYWEYVIEKGGANSISDDVGYSYSMKFQEHTSSEVQENWLEFEI